MTTRTSLSDPNRIRRITEALNAARNQRRSPDSAACRRREPGDWYAVYFTGNRLQVEVFVDEIDCGVITNGALAASTTPDIHNALAAAF